VKVRIEGAVRYVDSKGTLEISLPAARYKNITLDGKAVILNNARPIKLLSKAERHSLLKKRAIVTIEFMNEEPRPQTAEEIISEYFDKHAAKSTVKTIDPLQLKAYIRQWALDTHSVSRRTIENITRKLILKIAPSLGFQITKVGTIFKHTYIMAEINNSGIPTTEEYRMEALKAWM